MESLRALERRAGATLPFVEDQRGVGEAVGREEQLHLEGNAVDVLVGEGVGLREEKLVARALQLQAALVLDRAEQLPGVAAVGNELRNGGELAVHGGQQRLALGERGGSTFTQ